MLHKFISCIASLIHWFTEMNKLYYETKNCRGAGSKSFDIRLTNNIHRVMCEKRPWASGIRRTQKLQNMVGLLSPTVGCSIAVQNVHGSMLSRWEIKGNILNDPKKGNSKYSKLQYIWWQQRRSCLKGWKVRRVSSRGSTTLHRCKDEVPPSPPTPTTVKLSKFGTRLYRHFEKSFSQNVTTESVINTTKFISHKEKMTVPWYL